MERTGENGKSTSRLKKLLVHSVISVSSVAKKMRKY